MKTIDGKAIATHIKQTVKHDAHALQEKGITPHLGIVLVGNNKASETYVGVKKRAAEQAGITISIRHLPKEATTEEVISAMQLLQTNSQLHGLIVQLPLPDHIDTNAVLNTIDPRKDVDCLTDVNLGKLIVERELFTPPTPGAVMAVLKHEGITNLAGKNITLVGTGQLVGRPLSAVLINTKASVTTVNETTHDIKEKCLAADIIVSGVGKAGIITSEMVGDGAIVIDTGVDYVNGKITGDIDIKSFANRDVFVTPTPGGIGPITVAKLLENTIMAAKHTLIHPNIERFNQH